MTVKEGKHHSQGSSSHSASSPGAMTLVFVFFVMVATLAAAFTGNMKAVSDASFQAAKDAVTLSLSLIGVMAFWLGMVRVLEAGGLVFALARWVKPLMVRLFPEVPADHPAMGAMVMNITANALGLGNAATPFGIKAMTELNRLNPLPGTATNAMCLFLAINTSSVTILPLGVIGVRAAAGAAAPAAIFLPTLLATTASTVTGILTALFLAKRDRQYQERIAELQPTSGGADTQSAAVVADDYSHLLFHRERGFQLLARLGIAALFLTIVIAGYRAPDPTDFVLNQLCGFWLMPILMFLIVSYGIGRGVKVYEAVTEGAKQGFDTAVRIIPFLVAILVSIAMFRASGAMGAVAAILAPVTDIVFLPPETLPMAILRPLSGTGAFGVMSELVNRDPNSYSAFVSSVMMGAADTTFYILAVYFGAVGVIRVRHALAAGMAADIAGMIAAGVFSRIFF